MPIIVTIDSEFESVSTLGYETVRFLSSETKNTVIRWGNSENTDDGLSEFKKVINPAKSISLNCNKLKALEKMSKVVDTPRIYKKKTTSKQLILIRPLHHTNGVDFKVVRGPTSISYDHYGTAWIDTKLEYRVWFAWDKTICAERVKLSDDEVEENKYPCRSSWAYSFIKNTPKKLHNDVMKAAKTIGLSLGAADVLVKNGKYIFLELNSAPTVDADPIRLFYQKEINSRLT